MKTTLDMKQHRRIPTAILLTGLAAAAIIYVTAEELPVDPLSEFENSKKFAYEVERMGGKMALVANDLSNWFSGLWHGRRLAFTVVIITIVAAAVYHFVAFGNMIDPEDR